MRTLEGIAVSPGVAIGEALVIDNEGFRIPRRFVSRDVVDAELQRLDEAIAAVGSEIERNRDEIAQQLGEQCGAIFSAHLQMVRDPHLRTSLEDLIRNRHYSPEYAVSRTLREYAKAFQSLKNSYMAERAHDITDIEKRLLGNLLGRRREELSHLTSPVVILAHNLTPSETANLDPRFVLGFVTEIGGLGGHTAIVAEALELPAIVGIGQFLTDVSGGDVVIVDGDHGKLTLQPDEETIAHYRHEEEEHRSLAVQLESLRGLPAETLDGTRIQLTANIEFPHEVAACKDRGSDGIGLYRTEFLYLGVDSEPTEETHFNAYSQVVREIGDQPLVIRTLDLGADKLGRTPHADEEERNPFLGMRSIRMSLRNLPAFRIQLRAALRASALGDVKLMFPLISTLQELRQAKSVVHETMEDLEEENVPFDRNLQIGIMVEVPSVITIIDRFLKETDFISIGTNDLIQYALAVDRANKDVAHLYRASDPSVLRLIETAVRAANEANIPANICGQMSGSTRYTMMLLGMGLRGFSVPPSAIPEIKKVCRSVTIEQCQQVAARALEMDHPQEIDNYLDEQLKQVAPELLLC